MATTRAAVKQQVVTAKFEGDAISLHVFFAGHEIPMAQNGMKWSGTQSYDVAGTVRAELVFKAPAGTDYAFVLRVDGARKVDDSGTSVAPLFTRGYDVEV